MTEITRLFTHPIYAKPPERDRLLLHLQIVEQVPNHLKPERYQTIDIAVALMGRRASERHSPSEHGNDMTPSLADNC